MGGCLSNEKGPAVPQITFDMNASNDGNGTLDKSLAKAPGILKMISDYTGCDEYVKEVR